ncbi:MAG TPA: hypothetical protein VET24_07275 [Actinomycetota bacterium]|nr:hypothetical protein [Actinomycetota bacterium]
MRADAWVSQTDDDADNAAEPSLATAGIAAVIMVMIVALVLVHALA